MLLHFDDLKRDLTGEMRRIARFLDVPIDEVRWPEIVQHCTFDWMKAHAATVAPLGGVFWDGGAERFIYKGTNGRWRDTLTTADCVRYERLAQEQLGPNCAQWLAAGASAT